MAMPATQVEIYEDHDVREAQAAVRTVADEARELVIHDDASDLAAKTLLGHVTSARKRIEALKKRWLDPLNQQVKLIRGDFDAMAAPAAEAEQILRGKVAVYYREKQEAARREEERLRKLAEKRQEKAIAKAEAKGEEPPLPVIPMPTIAAPAKTTRTETGSAVTMRKVWKWRVVDEQQIPREYFVLDEKKLNAVVKAGLREIPGVEVYETEEVTVR